MNLFSSFFFDRWNEIFNLVRIFFSCSKFNTKLHFFIWFFLFSFTNIFFDFFEVDKTSWQNHKFQLIWTICWNVIFNCSDNYWPRIFTQFIVDCEIGLNFFLLSNLNTVLNYYQYSSSRQKDIVNQFQDMLIVQLTIKIINQFSRKQNDSIANEWILA